MELSVGFCSVTVLQTKYIDYYKTAMLLRVLDILGQSSGAQVLCDLMLDGLISGPIYCKSI